MRRNVGAQATPERWRPFLRLLRVHAVPPDETDPLKTLTVFRYGASAGLGGEALGAADHVAASVDVIGAVHEQLCHMHGIVAAHGGLDVAANDQP